MLNGFGRESLGLDSVEHPAAPDKIVPRDSRESHAQKQHQIVERRSPQQEGFNLYVGRSDYQKKRGIDSRHSDQLPIGSPEAVGLVHLSDPWISFYLRTVLLDQRVGEVKVSRVRRVEDTQFSEKQIGNKQRIQVFGILNKPDLGEAPGFPGTTMTQFSSFLVGSITRYSFAFRARTRLRPTAM